MPFDGTPCLREQNKVYSAPSKCFFFSFFKRFYLSDRQRSQVGREAGRKRSRLPAEQRAQCRTGSQDPSCARQHGPRQGGRVLVGAPRPLPGPCFGPLKGWVGDGLSQVSSPGFPGNCDGSPAPVICCFSPLLPCSLSPLLTPPKAKRTREPATDKGFWDWWSAPSEAALKP